MTETVSVDLPANTWVKIADSKANVTAQLSLTGTARVYVGSTEPVGDIGPVMSSDGSLSLSEVSGNVYLRSADIANVAWVIRG